MKCSWSQIEVIHKRIGHITVSYKNLILVWGGIVVENPPQIVDRYPADQLWIYDTLTEVWTLVQSKGQLPYRNSGGSAVVFEDDLYLFGGIVEVNESDVYSNDLYRLNLLTFEWKKLEPTGKVPEQCEKGVGWTYNNKLYFFGGYGCIPQLSASIDYAFHLDGSHFDYGIMGWTSQFVCYDPKTNAWSSPKTRGIPPKPRAAHAADVSGHRVFIFGGREGVARNNDLYYIDMDSLTWGPNLNKDKAPDEIPEGRSWHSFTFITSTKAILYGGLKQYGVPSFDWWECCINDSLDIVWNKHPQVVSPLIWHKAALSKPTGELVIVGGTTNSPYETDKQDFVDKLLILQFQPISLFRLSLNTIVNDRSLHICPYSLPKSLVDLIEFRSNQTNYGAEV